MLRFCGHKLGQVRGICQSQCYNWATALTLRCCITVWGMPLAIPLSNPLRGVRLATVRMKITGILLACMMAMLGKALDSVWCGVHSAGPIR